MRACGPRQGLPLRGSTIETSETIYAARWGPPIEERPQGSRVDEPDLPALGPGLAALAANARARRPHDCDRDPRANPFHDISLRAQPLHQLAKHFLRPPSVVATNGTNSPDWYWWFSALARSLVPRSLLGFVVFQQALATDVPT